MRMRPNLLIAAVLKDLLAAEPNALAEGYLSAGSDLVEWLAARAIMLRADIVSVQGEQIRLTNRGRDLAKSNQLIAKRRAIN